MEKALAEASFLKVVAGRHGELQETFGARGGYQYQVDVKRVLRGWGLSRAVERPCCISAGRRRASLLGRLLPESPTCSSLTSRPITWIWPPSSG